MTAQDKVKELYDLLVEQQVAELKMSALNKKVKEAEAECYSQMETDGIDEIKINGIVFKPIAKNDFALKENVEKEAGDKLLKWDDYSLWFEWLKAIGEGGLIKTKESVHHGTRAKFLDEFLGKKNEQGEPNVLPDFIVEVFHNTMKYNKSAIKRDAQALTE